MTGNDAHDRLMVDHQLLIGMGCKHPLENKKLTRFQISFSFDTPNFVV